MKYQDNMTQYSTCSLNSYVDLLVSRMRDAISTKCHPWAVDRKWNQKDRNENLEFIYSHLFLEIEWYL
jgi:hypothetical protein